MPPMPSPRVRLRVRIPPIKAVVIEKTPATRSDIELSTQGAKPA
jgi:hypothetical protein